MKNPSVSRAEIHNLLSCEKILNSLVICSFFKLKEASCITIYEMKVKKYQCIFYMHMRKLDRIYRNLDLARNDYWSPKANAKLKN